MWFSCEMPWGLDDAEEVIFVFFSINYFLVLLTNIFCDNNIMIENQLLKSQTNF